MDIKVGALGLLFSVLVPGAFGKPPAKKIQILVTGLDNSAVEELKKSAPPNVRILTVQPGQVAAWIGNADALVSPALTPADLQAAKRLRWVQILNAGAARDIPLVKGKEITLTDLKVVLGPEVGDHAMALLLALTRGLYLTIPMQHAREWERSESLVGKLLELQGKTAVIVGVGGVGTQIAKRAAAFGMTVIGVDPNTTPRSFIERMVNPDQLDTVLPLANVVFVSVPLTPETANMFGAKQFREMKRGAFFIDVSRGEVYSAPALVKALASRDLAGAGLDVTNPEPLPRSSPLWKFRNVVITPHIAGASDGALARVLDLLQENIRRFAAGQPLLNTINTRKGY